MPRATRWSQLLPGVVTLSVIAAAAVAILLFAQVGALHGKTVRLFAVTSAARGVITGTEVWLAGQRIGLVEEVRFRPVSTDTTARLLLELEVLAEHAHLLRRDSFAQIRTGGSLIGAPVVYVSTGTPGAPPLRDGDTLATRPQADVAGFTTQAALAARHLPIVIENTHVIARHVRESRGSAGALLDAGVRELARFQRRASRLGHAVTAGNGTLGLAVRDEELAARARHAAAQVDSVRALLASDRTTVGRFRRDSTLARTIAELRTEVSVTRALLDEPRGSAGRFVRDSALVRQLTGFDAELGALLADVQRRPLRYVTF